MSSPSMIRVGSAWALAIGVIGCGGSTPNPPPAADLSPVADLGAPATVSVTFSLSQDSAGTMPLVGATMCLYPALTVCATSDATGVAMLSGAPANSQLLISVVAPGYASILNEIVSGTTNVVGAFYLLKSTVVSALAVALGVPYDLSKGVVHAQTSTAGITLALSPASGSGPFYQDANGIPDKMLMKTAAGDGVFVNVTPGMAEVAFAGKTCTVGSNAFPGSKPGTAAVAVAAGYITNLGVNCQ